MDIDLTALSDYYTLLVVIYVLGAIPAMFCIIKLSDKTDEFNRRLNPGILTFINLTWPVSLPIFTLAAVVYIRRTRPKPIKITVARVHNGQCGER